MIALFGNSLDEIGIGLGEWFRKQTTYKFNPPFAAIGFLDSNGNIQGVAIFNDFNDSNIDVHIYVPKCLTRANIKLVYNYVFNQLKCNRLTAKPYRSNKVLLRLLPRMGFQYEAVLKQYYGKNRSDDAIIYRLTRDSALKWVDKNNA